MENTPDDSTVALWVRLMRASSAVLDAIEGRLKAEGLPPLGWYDVLLEVERAGDDGLRPMALEERLLLPQYGTSRLLKRLEEAGLTVRAPCPEDGRGFRVTITEAGRQMRRRMWPVYAGVLQARIGDRFSVEERKAAVALLARLG
jgi:DNA-binding MarR family transcriptional regulator